MDDPLTSMVMLLANRATSQKLMPPAAIALGIAIALCIAIITARPLLCWPRRDDNRHWGMPSKGNRRVPLTDDMKASLAYKAGARSGESPAACTRRVKKSFMNYKRGSQQASNARNNPI